MRPASRKPAALARLVASLLVCLSCCSRGGGGASQPAPQNSGPIPVSYHVLRIELSTTSINILGIAGSVGGVQTTLAQSYATTGRAIRHWGLIAEQAAPKIWAATVQPGYDDHLQGKRSGGTGSWRVWHPPLPPCGPTRVQ